MDNMRVKIIAVLLLVVFGFSVFADGSPILYDPLRIFDEELSTANRIRIAGSVTGYTGFILFLAGGIAFGVGYWLFMQGSSYPHVDTIVWSGLGGASAGITLSISGLITWLVGNKRAFTALENQSNYLRITSGY